MTTSLYTHQTLEEIKARRFNEKHWDEKSQKHELGGVLEVVIRCFVENLVFDCIEVASRSSRSQMYST